MTNLQGKVQNLQRLQSQRTQYQRSNRIEQSLKEAPGGLTPRTAAEDLGLPEGGQINVQSVDR